MAYVDRNTYAENQSKLKLSNEKFKEIKDLFEFNKSELSFYKKQKGKIKAYLKEGDLQPAVVCLLHPLLIGAYSDEMDAVVMLKFPTSFINKYKLEEGQRLVTSNVYWPKDMFNIAEDIFVGEEYGGTYRDVIPIVSLFLTDKKNEEYVKLLTNIFDEDTWEKVVKKSNEYIKENPYLHRNGFFYLLFNNKKEFK